MARKRFSIVDEYARECPTLEVRRSVTAEVVQGELMRLFRERGVPGPIRSDNGPEFIERALREWLVRPVVQTLYVEGGAPWENGYAESVSWTVAGRTVERGGVQERG